MEEDHDDDDDVEVVAEGGRDGEGYDFDEEDVEQLPRHSEEKKIVYDPRP